MSDFMVFEAKAIGIVILSGVLLGGCASTPAQSTNYMSEGSGKSLPPPGTRVMVVSNHQGALTGAVQWLQHQGLIVIDPDKVEQELTDSAAARSFSTTRNLPNSEVAKSLDTDLVVSTYLKREFVPTDTGNQAMTLASVAIQGREVQTGHVAFESKAWNSDPIMVSDETVAHLTQVALEQAWRDQAPLTEAPLEVVAQERMAPSLPEASPAAVAPPSEVPPSQSTASQELSIRDPQEQSSLGLQVAGGALSILYTPLKVVYAGIGGLVGGLAYVLTAGNERAAQTIWSASLEGDYWITPQHLEGTQPLHFRGQSVGEQPGH
ncbi:MAG TPA: hypothetical protein PKZ24_00685 [Nitrospirales bacterium]|nr:hypothetical protein [Nitrospirales bacterium]